MRDAKAGDVFGCDFFDRLAVEFDGAAPAQHAADRTQQGGLACAVRAEDGGDAALLHGKTYAAQDILHTVTGEQVGDLEQRHR
jgi:hypothetical protein